MPSEDLPRTVLGSKTRIKQKTNVGHQFGLVNKVRDGLSRLPSGSAVRGYRAGRG